MLASPLCKAQQIQLRRPFIQIKCDAIEYPVTVELLGKLRNLLNLPIDTPSNQILAMAKNLSRLKQKNLLQNLFD